MVNEFLPLKRPCPEAAESMGRSKDDLSNMEPSQNGGGMGRSAPGFFPRNPTETGDPRSGFSSKVSVQHWTT